MNLTRSNLRDIYFPSIAPRMSKHCDVAHIIDPAERAEFEEENAQLGLPRLRCVR